MIDALVAQAVDEGSWQAFLILIVAFIGGLVIIYLGFDRYRVGRLIKNTPPQRVRSVAVGRTELHGFARDAGTTFDQPFTEGTCLYRDWTIEERRTQTRRTKDGRTKQEKKWVTIDSGTDVAPFYVEDDTGRMLVEADRGARFEISSENSTTITLGKGRSLPPAVAAFFQRDETPEESTEAIASALKASPMGGVLDDDAIDAIARGDYEAIDGDRHESMAKALPGEYVDAEGRLREDVDPEDLAAELSRPTDRADSAADGGFIGTVGSILSSGRDVLEAFQSDRPKKPSSRRRRRFSQEVLPVDEEVFVFGEARPPTEPSDAGLTIVTDESTGQFIVSDLDESGIVKYYNRRAPLYMLGGLALSAIALYLLLNTWFL
ncbi:MAG: GIDE domain-containing protein [Halobacteriota archaeon]